MPKSSKDNLRKAILDKRGQLSKEKIQSLSSLISKNIIKSNLFKKAEHVALYHAVRGEADPNKLMKSKKKFYLPILSKNKNRGLDFAAINEKTTFKDNQFLIPEPKVETNELIDVETLDIIIMPLLGFDLAGNRLGMGGGYYDRCFSFKQSDIKQNNAHKPILIGFAYEFQKIDSLDTEPWDIGLDAIVTEERFTTF